MICFHKPFTTNGKVNEFAVRGSYNRPIAIDERGVYILDRKSREPKIGHDYYKKLIPYGEIARLRIYPETQLKRFFGATVGVITSAAICALLVLAFTHGIHLLEPMLILVPPAALITFGFSYFGALGTYFSIETAQRKYTVNLNAKQWDQDKDRIHALIRQSRRPFEFATGGRGVETSL